MEEQLDQIQATLEAELAGKYDIVSRLGMGGMAIVFLANDVKHDRQVAVKVLLPELAASIGADRFLREITTTAKLSHPHILPLYDSGAAGGQLYYVMPYIMGESLADRLERERQLPIDEAVKITREVADALAHAHSYGLVHRDIKPDNIMLAGGHAILADFGIARAVTDAGGAEQLTQTGTAIGTPAYMSPEQAAGDPSVDNRSDVYSLGCVLYEMLIGQIPFTGPTPQAIMARHTMDHLSPPSIMRDTISPELEDIIYRSMAKAPADRYKTAHDMVEALDQLMAGGGTTPRASAAMRRPSVATTRPYTATTPGDTRKRRTWIIAGAVTALAVIGGGYALSRGDRARAVGTGLDPNRVAVLYFEDLTSDSSLTYLADGLTEDIIDRLSRVQAIDVISRNGVEPFRGFEGPIDSVGRTLNAGVVVTGTVEPLRDRIRVSTSLIDGLSGSRIDGRSFELPSDEALQALDSASVRISEMLRARLGQEVAAREARAGTRSLEAWSLYQRGENLRKRAEQSDDLSASLRLLEQADSVLRRSGMADPGWAQPTALRARVAYQLSRTSDDIIQVQSAIDSAVSLADQALAQQPGMAEALEVRGTTRYWKWLLQLEPDPARSDALLEAARSDLEEAVDRDRSLASAQATLSHLYYNTDDVVDALLAAERAYDQDAYLEVADQVLWRLFLGSFDSERWPQARRWCAEGHSRFPNDFRFTECKLWEMTMPVVAPDPDSAWALYEQLVELVPESAEQLQSSRARMIVGGILARNGMVDSARSVLVNARLGGDVDTNQELPFIEAFMRTLAGDRDEAVALLKSYGVGTVSEDEAQGAVYWWFRSLTDHPEFDQIRGIVQ